MDKKFTVTVLLVVFAVELFTLVSALMFTGKILYPALVLAVLSGIGLIICHTHDDDNDAGYV